MNQSITSNQQSVLSVGPKQLTAVVTPPATAKPLSALEYLP